MRKYDEAIQLTKEQKAEAVSKIKLYLEKNFQVELGNLHVEIFLEYLTENIGLYYYNKAIGEALAFMNEKTEELYLLMKDEP